MTLATKRQFIVSIAGIPGNWESSSGGDVTAGGTKVYDGGADVPNILGGLPETSDLELTRTFDPDRDVELLTALRKVVGRGRFTLTRQATDANRVKIGKPETHANALLIGVTAPEHEEGSADSSPVKLTFMTAGAA